MSFPLDDTRRTWIREDVTADRLNEAAALLGLSESVEEGFASSEFFKVISAILLELAKQKSTKPSEDTAP